MNGLSIAAIAGTVSTAILAVIGIKCKDLLSTGFTSLLFFLSPIIRRGRTLRVQIGEKKYEGKICGFGLTRLTIKKSDGTYQLLLVKELKDAMLEVKIK